jgi:hypothetical protein
MAVESEVGIVNSKQTEQQCGCGSSNAAMPDPLPRPFEAKPGAGGRPWANTQTRTRILVQSSVAIGFLYAGRPI